MGFKPIQGNLFFRYLWEHTLKELCKFFHCLHCAENNRITQTRRTDLKSVLKERPFRQSDQRNGQQKPSSLVMHCHGDSQTKGRLSDLPVSFWPLTYQLPFGVNMSICWNHGWTVQSSAVQQPSDSHFLPWRLVNKKLGWNYQGVEYEDTIKTICKTVFFVNKQFHLKLLLLFLSCS